MSHPVSHDRAEETPEAKALWFRSLPLSERMEIFCSVTDLALTIDPRLPDRKDAQQAARRIRIVSADDLIAYKKAAGRPVDLEDVRLLEVPETEGKGE